MDRRIRSSTRSGRGRLPGFSRWIGRGRSVIGFTSRCVSRRTRQNAVSSPPWRLGAGWCRRHVPLPFQVLADPEGNEACVTTWQGRGD